MGVTTILWQSPGDCTNGRDHATIGHDEAQGLKAQVDAARKKELVLKEHI